MVCHAPVMVCCCSTLSGKSYFYFPIPPTSLFSENFLVQDNQKKTFLRQNGGYRQENIVAGGQQRCGRIADNHQ